MFQRGVQEAALHHVGVYQGQSSLDAPALPPIAGAIRLCRGDHCMNEQIGLGPVQAAQVEHEGEKELVTVAQPSQQDLLGQDTDDAGIRSRRLVAVAGVSLRRSRPWHWAAAGRVIGPVTTQGSAN